MVESEIFSRKRYGTLIRAAVVVAANHETLARDRGDAYEALLKHDAALRELLADCREVMADAAESPVEVHRDYRERFAELVAQIDEATPTRPPQQGARGPETGGG